MKWDDRYLPILLGGIFALGLLIGNWSASSRRDSFSFKEDARGKINTLIDFISEEYVDQVNTDSIVSLTLGSILARLDPHSVYIPASEQALLAQSMKGDFVGIGINFYMHNDSVAVVNPVKDGPSAKAGIKAGDRILFADKTKLYGRKLPTDSLFAKLKGEVGSQVELTVYRKSQRKTLKLTIKRDVVPIASVDISMLLKNHYGYIKINRFSATTYREFKLALASLKKQGMKSLLLDLRDNGGGYMEEAIAIADEFLKDKELIVFTKSKGQITEKSYATAKGAFESGKLFVLINEYSASASEIVAGAIQDNDRGMVVGRRSFGKGLVQREMDFKDGSAVRLTIARYYTPAGRSIQRPYNKGAKEYFDEAALRQRHGELYAKDSIKVLDSLRYKTKKGKIVYGGGGIIPDVFVPLESKLGNENILPYLQSGIMDYFVFEQLDKDRSAFEEMNFGEFETIMGQSNRYFDRFQNYMTKNGLLLDIRPSKEIVKSYIKAEFARQLFGVSYYYKLILREDAVIKAVLKEDL